MDADIIIAVCAPTRACFDIASVAIRTCVEYSSGANVVIAANNMPVPEFKKELKELTEILGAKWSWYGDGPFNICRCFNVHIDATSRKFYGVFGQDVIFYHNWLANLIESWEREPDYFCLQPYTFNTFRKEANALRAILLKQGKAIHETRQGCGACFMFRRDRPPLFVWDEKCPTEGDTDLWCYLRSNKLREGLVLNSRVDHLGQVVQSDLGGYHPWIHGYEDPTIYLRNKWKLNSRNEPTI